MRKIANYIITWFRIDLTLPVAIIKSFEYSLHLLSNLRIRDLLEQKTNRIATIDFSPLLSSLHFPILKPKNTICIFHCFSQSMDISISCAKHAFGPQTNFQYPFEFTPLLSQQTLSYLALTPKKV